MARNKDRKKRSPEKRLIAVIDIGSNSVRLVVYKGLKRTPDIMFNERVLCGLGAGVGTDGYMHKDSMTNALLALKRFSVLCEDMLVDEVATVGTSAVRDARNGPEFVQKVKELTGFKVDVITGNEEARLSAYGVLAGFPNAEGLVGDLGGGSLELIHVKEGKKQHVTSLPIGPVRVLDDAPVFTEEHEKFVLTELAKADWIKEFAGEPFYMVGGAWRSLALLHIIQSKWPLNVLHEYTVSQDKMKRFCWEIERKDPSVIEGIERIPMKRVVTLPLSARILREIIRTAKPSRIVTSSYGIREGLMFKKLNHAKRAQDPLIETTLEFGRSNARFPKHGDRLIQWTDELFKDETKADRRIREAVCHLSEISHTSHPDFKANLAFYRSIVGRFVGVTHQDRCKIALALFSSYKGNPAADIIKPALKILTRAEADEMYKLGQIIRFAQKFTGGTDRPLKKSKIYQRNKTLTLEIRGKEQALISNSESYRLSKLAEILGMKSKIKYT